MNRRFAVLAIALFGWAAHGGAPPPDDLSQHRNLGQAFYENPTTHREAVEEFRKALALAPDSAPDRVNYGLALLRAGRTQEGIAELERAQQRDPKIPHTWFALGIEFKKAADYPRATLQFERMVRLVPDEPISHFNLGYLYRLAGRTNDARAEFERAAALDLGFAAPHFQLFNLHRDARQTDAAAREQETFLRLKRQQAEADIHEDVDWSRYAEVVAPPEPHAAAARDAAVDVRFSDTLLGGTVDPATVGALVIDVDGDGRPDALVWSQRGIRLFRNGETPVERSGLEGITDVRAVAAGDFDNDGLADLCVVTETAALLFANRGGVFERAPMALPSGHYEGAVWIDFDHDYDLDLLLLGAPTVLMRNNGSAGFSDETRQLPLVAGHALAAAVLNIVSEQAGHDLVVSYSDRPGVLYRDRLAGGYQAETVDGIAAGARSLAAHDIDNDGAVDLIAAGPRSLTVLLNRAGRFDASPLSPHDPTPIAFADIENRGVLDLVAGGSVLRNGGAGAFGRATPLPVGDLAAAAAADFDLDGRADLIAVGRNGSIHLLRNDTPARHHWIRVGLTGVKNPKLPAEAQVEVKAGAHYQKLRYAGVPVTFGLGDRASIDAVRITWPNGLIQNELRPPADAAVTYKEAPRLSGSCPMIFTWNGRAFQFISDVLGVAPLGASAGDGAYFAVADHEYVRIPGGALRPRDNFYEVRITEELREVSYLDQIQLVAVDHPRGVDVLTNDKFKAPPFPDFRLFGVTHRVYPARAQQGGSDVRAALLETDGVYAEGFRHDHRGVADLHSLDLDFAGAAPDNRAILVLTGWVDWADGSTFRAAAQERRSGLTTPYLQVKDAAGHWRTVIDDMGIPAGKPKTIVVDLSGKFLSSSREVRIVTDMCVHWDEIFLSEDSAAPSVRLTGAAPVAAELAFRGFSRPTIDPDARHPEAFEYGAVSATSMWNPTPGRYTRYGDVTVLLGEADDRFVIMGSGDELRARFAASAFPRTPEGWTRDFLLLVGGWAKDGDANTAFSQTVEPLPFHGMSAYPYSPPQHYPTDEVHRAYRDTFNTRPALRLIRPLSVASGPTP